MTKVREIITLSGWVDGSGWSYTQTYSDQIIDVAKVDPRAEMDWGWWEAGRPIAGQDTQIAVSYYAIDADPTCDNPLASWSIWESEL